MEVSGELNAATPSPFTPLL